MAEARSAYVTGAQPDREPASRPSGIRVAVAGVSGYAGGELARILLRHPRLSSSPPVLFGRAETGGASGQSRLLDLHPHLNPNEDLEIHPFSWATLREHAVDVLMLATPHEQSRVLAPLAVERGTRVIDLSGAWRLSESQNRAVYRHDDDASERSAKLQDEAVYGSPELHRDKIAAARLVANPGCYATSIILALSPLVSAGLIDLEHGIICDAKSGVSGAGKTPSPGTHFMYAAENLSAYSVFGHRHTGEILEQLHLAETQLQFTPHLLPIPRGILSTIYLRLRQASTSEKILDLIRNTYRDSPFVRVRKPGLLPQIQHVVRTNFCDLGLTLHADGHRAVLVSCLDNLLKGASGQAIQNLNLMCGWGETEGLL